jgi:3-isopropylmalate/(R)-2-methylmalate dehydratase small subunit
MTDRNLTTTYRGTAWCLGDNVSTDEILPGRYMAVRDPTELARHALAGIDTSLAGSVQPGDILVAGSNFGTGSSRESAPHALKYAGFAAIAAESFARIFYRNCINIGLPVFWASGLKDFVKTGDVVAIDASAGVIVNTTTQTQIASQPLPAFVLRIVAQGGLANYARERIGQPLVPRT